MVRQKRAKFIKQLTPELLKAELYAHIKRALRTTEETSALLATQGYTYEEICSVASELAGHWGRVIALAREGSRRKLYGPEVTLERLLSAAPLAVRGQDPSK